MTSEDLIAEIDLRLRSIQERPAMWGSWHMIEATIMTLTDIRDLVQDLPADYRGASRWRSACRQVCYVGPLGLIDALRGQRADEQALKEAVVKAIDFYLSDEVQLTPKSPPHF